MSDPLTSLKAMIDRIEAGTRMVDASILKRVYEIQGMPEKAAALEHGPRLLDEAALRDLATFKNEMSLVNTFQERGERLIDGAAFKALAIAGQTPPGPTGPPINVDAPHATGSTGTVGNVVTCTMGNWQNEPTSYSYQWQSEGINVGTAGPNPSFTITAGQQDTFMRCNVTATNALGSATATSNSFT